MKVKVKVKLKVKVKVKVIKKKGLKSYNLNIRL